MNKRLYGNLLLFAVVLAGLVVVLGAYTRLADAGLGCPDWPGCYGHFIAPVTDAEIARAEQEHAWRPVDFASAVKEMVHRYFAGGLILTVFVLMVLAWKNHPDEDAPVGLATAVMVLILFQAALGMWTVTWKLKPIVVTAHLLGGFTTLALLWLMVLRTRRIDISPAVGATIGFKFACLIGLLILVMQITLGGWTSSNYAALACPDFPTCQARWWPTMNWSEGFILWRGIGRNYEFGILQSDARTAIHMAHRIGAILTFLYITTLSIALMKADISRGIKRIAGIVMTLLLVQIFLGISNIIFFLPLVVATAHNAVGAMLLLSMVTLIYAIYSGSSHNTRAEVQSSG